MNYGNRFAIALIGLISVIVSSPAFAWESCEYQADAINRVQLPDWRSTGREGQRRNIIKHIGKMVDQGCSEALYKPAATEIGCKDSACTAERREMGLISQRAEQRTKDVNFSALVASPDSGPALSGTAN